MNEDSFPNLMENQAEQAISFFSEDIDFILANQDIIQKWINLIIEQEKNVLSYINYIFCSDTYLHKINLEYLEHDTLTDIITFPYTEAPPIESDVFISIDRVKENAKIFNASFERELYRVIIHGVLHLCGYSDKDDESKKLMRKKEDEAIQILEKLS
jgi:rRNA maturation RNase YbeY